ncbi:MAG: NADH-quinone oxidoreductase subunit C [Candidatus Atribacteria bacterium]|nr:NADH-quinone oxidoreductase subunit C [Candidatus Atribacteria bacterium]
MEYIKPGKIIELFEEKFDGSVINSKIEIKTAGLKKNSYNVIWLQINPEDLKNIVKFLCSITPFPHFAMISGNDIGENIELIYHFSIYYGERFKETSISLVMHLSKKNLKILTITDLIPGAQTAEREIKEMFGVIVEGLPDLANIFLPKDFPKGVYPLRKDEKGAAKMVNKEEEVKKVE